MGLVWRIDADPGVEALVARVDEGRDGQAAGYDGRQLLLLGDRLACGVAVEFDQHVTKGGHVLIAGAAVVHRVDAHVETELGREGFFDSALGLDVADPIGGRLGATTFGHSRAFFAFAGYGNGDKLVGTEAGFQEPAPAIGHG